MQKEDDDYCDLIYEDLYEDGVVKFNDLSDEEFKRLIRKHYNYIKKIASEGLYAQEKRHIRHLKKASHWDSVPNPEV